MSTRDLTVYRKEIDGETVFVISNGDDGGSYLELLPEEMDDLIGDLRSEYNDWIEEGMDDHLKDLCEKIEDLDYVSHVIASTSPDPERPDRTIAITAVPEEDPPDEEDFEDPMSQKEDLALEYGQKLKGDVDISHIPYLHITDLSCRWNHLAFRPDYLDRFEPNYKERSDE